MTRSGAGLALCALLACSDPPRPQQPTPAPAPDAAEEGTGLEPDRPLIEEVPEEERIAAIEVAMNQLAPVANQCWAAAAADDFRLAGDVRAFISVGAPAGPGAAVEITANTTDDDSLGRCLAAVLAAYPWAPPLAGQGIELPFHFAAPAMQNVVDRLFVPHRAQAGVDIAVLLDETNTGNPALSLAEVNSRGEIKVGGREAERLELWTMSSVSIVTIRVAGGKQLTAGPGDVIIVPKGARLAIEPGPILQATVAFVPGGREGTLRAGALPGKAVALTGPLRKGEPQVTVVKADTGKLFPRPGGATTILVEPPAAGGAVSLSWQQIAKGAKVPPHVHAKETEVLLLDGGGGPMTIAGVAVTVKPGSAIQVPAGVEHSFEATEDTLGLQYYTPAGPEQRFKKKP